MRLCQFKKRILGLFILGLLFGCSTSKIVAPDEKLNKASSLEGPVSLDENEPSAINLFFDRPSEFNQQTKNINFIITTPENSSIRYNFDLYSGALYKDRDYCPLDDIWGKKWSSLFKPNFTQGIIPSAYDQNLRPQRIIIFSSFDNIPKFKYQPTQIDVTRIIGSVIYENCESFPCDMKESWKRSQILVGVIDKNEDDAFSNIKTLTQLKRRVDWSYVKAFLSNQDGVFKIGAKNYPAFRIGKEYDSDDTIKYFLKYSTQLSANEWAKWKSGCLKLYDDFYNESVAIRESVYGQRSKFLNLFKKFYSKNSDLFYQCQKSVRTGNINDDYQRHWFFTYIQAFTLLNKNGFYYNCSERGWFYNPKVNGKKYYTDQAKELERCRPADLEKSFEQIVNGLVFMKDQMNKSFRYIEYDSQHGGTHQKLYSFVEDFQKMLTCKDKKESHPYGLVDFFPQDVVWQSYLNDEENTVK